MGGMRKLYPGDFITTFPSETWNNLIDGVEKVRRAPAQGDRFMASGGARRLKIQVLNASGADIETSFPVLKLTEPIVTPGDSSRAVLDEIAMKGDTPDDETGPSQIVVMQGPVSANRPGTAVLIGLSWVRVEFSSDEHRHAEPIPDDNTKLQSAESGIPIIWHEELGSEFPEEVWAVVLLGPGGASAESGIGKANETIANRASGDISIWRGTFGSETDTEQDREMFNLGPEVEEGDWVAWQTINGQLVFGKLCS